MLQVNDITYRIGGRVLLEQATLSVPKGHNVALIGPNGAGKTTLLRMITGDVSPDEGTISVPPGWRVAMGARRQHQVRN